MILLFSGPSRYIPDSSGPPPPSGISCGCVVMLLLSLAAGSYQPPPSQVCQDLHVHHPDTVVKC